uniref:Uncharacterized protein n=1 Tax=Octopus bimaculoides TaxID=37653 RepID=A0A0L8I5I6_OCTBM
MDLTPREEFAETLETIYNVVSSSPVLPEEEYLIRYDRLGQYIQWNACKYYRIKFHDKWYRYNPEDVVNGKSVTILWNFLIQTDRKIDSNRPEIVIKDYNRGTCLLIEMSVLHDQNVSRKECGKLSHYKDLQIEITQMWMLSTTIIPVVIGALGMIKKGAEKYIKQLSANSNLSELQKITLMGAAHILRKALSI